MSKFSEIYNSQNPNLVLTPENGWYEMRLADDLPVESALTIAILFFDELKWGYWDYDPVTDKKEWIAIDVPEPNPELVKREIPYTPEEQREIDKFWT